MIKISQYLKDQTGDVNFSITYNEAAKTFNASVNGKFLTYNVDADTWNISSTESSQIDTTTTGMQKSIGSVRLAFGCASAIVGLSVLSLFFIPLGFFPLAAIVGTFFGANALFLANQKSALEIAKSKIAESDEEDAELIGNLLSSLSKNTRDALVKALGGEDKVNEGKIVLDLTTNNGELFEVSEGILHVNAGMLKHFLENGNVKNIMVVSFKINPTLRKFLDLFMWSTLISSEEIRNYGDY